ncbi:hypothetical protein HanRHA438_Chr02g0066801 [Helianthus annuus]|nr:hypothetical protein HanRHA438_Chr02g0066801 [Helianthus annuus]
MLFGVEVEDDESEDVLFWEGELAGELEGLPEYEEVLELGTIGDLDYLEALLEDGPTRVIEPTPDEKIQCGDQPVKVEEESHDSWPVVFIIKTTK